MLKKEIKELNKRNNMLCSWTGKLNIVKVAIVPRLIDRFNEIPIKIPARSINYGEKLTENLSDIQMRF